MSLTYLLLLLVVVSNAIIEELFTVPVSDILNDEEAIESYAAQLENDGYFKIDKLLDDKAAKALSNLLAKAPISRSDVWKNPWQVPNINPDYPTDHPINTMAQAKVGFVGRTDMPHMFNVLYNYEPILQLFRAIMMKNNYESLFLSSDPEGSIYGLVATDGDIGGPHLDQHPLCYIKYRYSDDIYGLR